MSEPRRIWVNGYDHSTSPFDGATEYVRLTDEERDAIEDCANVTDIFAANAESPTITSKWKASATTLHRLLGR